jgi:hypothetical protein
MGCPYYEVGYFGTCAASETVYVPSIKRMETCCFQKTYRLCPTLSEYLYENDMAMANRPPEPRISRLSLHQRFEDRLGKHRHSRDMR